MPSVTSVTSGLAFAFDGCFIMLKENWKDINGYEGLYVVNKFGMVKALKKTIVKCNNVIQNRKECILKNSICRIGYSKHILYKGVGTRKEFKTHRLVAIAFIPNPLDKPCVNHLDGDKQNNFYKNLEWCTRSENSIHSYKNGFHNWKKYGHPKHKK